MQRAREMFNLKVEIVFTKDDVATVAERGVAGTRKGEEATQRHRQAQPGEEATCRHRQPEQRAAER